MFCSKGQLERAMSAAPLASSMYLPKDSGVEGCPVLLVSVTNHISISLLRFCLSNLRALHILRHVCPKSSTKTCMSATLLTSAVCNSNTAHRAPCACSSASKHRSDYSISLLHLSSLLNVRIIQASTLDFFDKSYNHAPCVCCASFVLDL
jgi:hypothetical protein